MNMDKSDNFLACKGPLDAMYRCYTEEKYGQSLSDAPEYTKPYQQKLANCLFRDGAAMDVCMSQFSNVVRAIYRSGDDKLNDKN